MISGRRTAAAQTAAGSTVPMTRSAAMPAQPTFFHHQWPRVGAAAGILSVAIVLAAALTAQPSAAGDAGEADTQPQDATNTLEDVHDCPDPVSVEIQRRGEYVHGDDVSSVKQDLIRLGLVDALQQVAGAEIARSTQTATRSDFSSVERETREHMVLRSEGRVIGWRLLSENIESDDMSESGTVMLLLDVEVCNEPRPDQPMVIAIAGVNGIEQHLADAFRSNLADTLSSYDSLIAVRDLPKDSYHDIRLRFKVNADIEKVDNTARAQVLEQFGASNRLGASSMIFDLITAQVTVMAVRFVDQETISESVERRRRVDDPDDAKRVVAEVILEALEIASAKIGERLDRGKLSYGMDNGRD